MSKSTFGLRKAGLSTLAVTLTLGAAFAGVGSANAVEGFTFDRIGGDNRYETAALIADEFNETNAHVILANGEPGSYADALSANFLAGELNAPVLLTRDGFTPDAIKAQLEQQGTTTITVVGGAGVVSDEQVAQLEADGYTVNRVAGSDRFATNAEVIADGGAAEGGVGIIATGFNFPDALAAGPISFQGHPLGLSTENDIKDEVIDALKGAGVTKVLIMGGESAVGSAVVAKLAANGITVAERFAGSDRSDTSEKAAEWALANLGFTDEHVNVASGYVQGYGADALAGGPLTGKQDRPLLITKNVDNPGDVVDFLEAHANTLIDGAIFGGTGAVSADAQAEMEAAAAAITTNQSYTVSPSDSASFGASNDADSKRTYTVTGLDDSKTYNIALFPSENVDTSSEWVKFADADKNDVADFTATDVDIKSVNNATVSDDNGVVLGAQPVNGTVKFTINTDTPDSVIPVVYLDADSGATDGAPDLDLNADDTPSEMFGIGGETTYTPQAAGAGALASSPVQSNDEAANTFVAGAGSAAKVYSYDANDNFYDGTEAAGNELTMAEFEAALTTGDNISAAYYYTNPDFSTTWILDDAAPTQPQAVAVAPTTGSETSSLTVTWNAPTAGDIDSYNVYRAEGTAAAKTYPGDYTKVGTVNGDVMKYVDSGLKANTTYSYVVTAVDQGQESEAADTTDEAEGTTAATPPAPITIESADVTTDTVPEGAPNAGDVWTLVFNDDASGVADDGLFRLQDGNGDIYQVQCGATDASTAGTTADANTASAFCELGDAEGSDTGSNDELTVTLVEAPTDRNAAGDDALTYPSQIINLANGNVDLAGSADKTIG